MGLFPIGFVPASLNRFITRNLIMLLKTLWSTAFDKKVSPSSSVAKRLLPVESRIIANGRSASG